MEVRSGVHHERQLRPTDSTENSGLPVTNEPPRWICSCCRTESVPDDGVCSCPAIGPAGENDAELPLYVSVGGFQLGIHGTVVFNHSIYHVSWIDVGPAEDG